MLLRNFDALLLPLWYGADGVRGFKRLWSFIIIWPNLKKFGQVIVRYYLSDPPDQIKIGLFNHLFG
jgi:hypothetical protein